MSASNRLRTSANFCATASGVVAPSCASVWVVGSVGIEEMVPGPGFNPAPAEDDLTATNRGRNATWALSRGPWRRSRPHMLLRRSHQRRKSLRIAHGHIRQNLAVDIDAADLQSVNQLAVGHAIGPRRRPDALDPQRAVVPLAHAPVAIGVPQR